MFKANLNFRAMEFRSKFLMLTCSLFMTAAFHSVSAQPFILPQFNDTEVSWPSSGVENTGTAVLGFNIISDEYGDTTATRQAVVWDGESPGLALYLHYPYYNELSNVPFTREKVTDPDVVIDPVSGNRITVVYESGGYVYYEHWKYDPSSGLNFVSTGNLSSIRSGQESHPNIDVNEDGLAAVVWQDAASGALYSTTLDVANSGAPFGTNSGQSYRVLSLECDIIPAITPDITISYSYEISDYLMTVSFIHNHTSFTAVGVHDIPLTEMRSNEHNCNTAFIDFQWRTDEILSNPRISNKQAQTVIVDDRNVVWASLSMTARNNEIRSITRTSSFVWSGINVVNNGAADLRNASNTYTGTAFALNFPMNVWGWKDYTSQLNNTWEPLMIHLRPDATFHNPNYFVIPANGADGLGIRNYRLPSIDARFDYDHIGLAFYDELTEKMLVKRGYYDMIIDEYYLRKGTENLQAQIASKSTELKAYPNPVNDFCYIEGVSSINDISIKDLTGRVMRADVSTQNDKVVIDFSSLSAGTYIVMVQGESTTKQFKMIKQ